MPAGTGADPAWYQAQQAAVPEFDPEITAYLANGNFNGAFQGGSQAEPTIDRLRQ